MSAADHNARHVQGKNVENLQNGYSSLTKSLWMQYLITISYILQLGLNLLRGSVIA